MTEIEETDRFECKVVNVIDNLQWKGVTVEDEDSGGRVYFSRVKANGMDIEIGSSLYIGVRLLSHDLDEMNMEVHLYDENDNELDWTII